MIVFYLAHSFPCTGKEIYLYPHASVGILIFIRALSVQPMLASLFSSLPILPLLCWAHQPLAQLCSPLFWFHCVGCAFVTDGFVASSLVACSHERLCRLWLILFRLGGFRQTFQVHVVLAPLLSSLSVWSWRCLPCRCFQSGLIPACVSLRSHNVSGGGVAFVVNYCPLRCRGMRRLRSPFVHV